MSTGPKFALANGDTNGLVGQNGIHHPSHLSIRALAAVIHQLLHIHLKVSQPKGLIYFLASLSFVVQKHKCIYQTASSLHIIESRAAFTVLATHCRNFSERWWWARQELDSLS